MKEAKSTVWVVAARTYVLIEEVDVGVGGNSSFHFFQLAV